MSRWDQEPGRDVQSFNSGLGLGLEECITVEDGKDNDFTRWQRGNRLHSNHISVIIVLMFRKQTLDQRESTNTQIFSRNHLLILPHLHMKIVPLQRACSAVHFGWKSSQWRRQSCRNWKMIVPLDLTNRKALKAEPERTQRKVSFIRASLRWLGVSTRFLKQGFKWQSCLGYPKHAILFANVVTIWTAVISFLVFAHVVLENG